MLRVSAKAAQKVNARLLPAKAVPQFCGVLPFVYLDELTSLPVVVDGSGLVFVPRGLPHLPRSDASAEGAQEHHAVASLSILWAVSTV